MVDSTPVKLLSGARILPPVNADFSRLRVVITGAGGTLGSGLFRALQGKCAALVGVDNRESAMFDGLTLGEADHEHLMDPNIIFHCAAYKHIDLGEKHPHAFHENNVRVTDRLATLVTYRFPKARIILASTDKAAGASIMGGTKYQAEKIVNAVAGVAVRMVNLVRSSGSVIETWERELKRRKPLLKVVQGAIRYWMQPEDAVNAMLYAARLPRGIYSVWGFPQVGVEEMAKTLWAMKRKDKPNLTYIPLRPGEALVEHLVGDNETAIQREEPWLREIK